MRPSSSQTRRTIIPVMAVLALVAGLFAALAAAPPNARADGRYGLLGTSLAYDHGPVGASTILDGLENNTPNTSQQNWMAWVRNDTKLNMMSIPGTHDSFAYHGGPSPRTQGICGSAQPDTSEPCDIKAQLNAGIRYFDVRAECRREDGEDRLKIYHGPISQKAYVREDFLEPVQEWLAEHPTETVIVRLSRDGLTPNRWEFLDPDEEFEKEPVVADTCEDTPDGKRSITHHVDQYFNDPEFADLFYRGTTDEPIPSANAPTHIPTLGEVRQHLVVFDSFRSSDDNFHGWDWKNDHVDTCCDSEANASTFQELAAHWDSAKEHLEDSDDALASAPTKYWYTSLDGSKFLTPAEIAFGDGATAKGMNYNALRFLFKGNVERTGILQMDFPGAGLINAIIGLNLRDANTTVGHFRGSFGEMADKLVRGASPDSGGGDAQDVVCYMVTCSSRTGYFGHAAPNVNVHAVGFAGSVAVGFVPTLGWAKNDTGDGIGSYIFQTGPADPRMPQSLIRSTVDDILSDITSGDKLDRVSRLLNELQRRYPWIQWFVAARNGERVNEDFYADDGYLKGEWHNVSYWVGGYAWPPGVITDFDLNAGIEVGVQNPEARAQRGTTASFFAVLEYDPASGSAGRPDGTVDFTKDGQPLCTDVPVKPYNRYDRLYAECTLDVPADEPDTSFELAVTGDFGDWKNAEGNSPSATRTVYYQDPYVYDNGSSTTLTATKRAFGYKEGAIVAVFRDEDGEQQTGSGTYTVFVDGAPMEGCTDVAVIRSSCDFYWPSPGTHEIYAAFSGNLSGSLAPSTSEVQTVSVAPILPKIDVTASASTVVDGQSVTFTAEISPKPDGFSQLPNDPNLRPVGGTVNFSNNTGDGECESVPVLNGVATCTIQADIQGQSLSAVTGEVNPIVMHVRYGGDGAFAPWLEIGPEVTVERAPSQTTLTGTFVTVSGTPMLRLAARTFAAAPASGVYPTTTNAERTSFAIDGQSYAPCASVFAGQDGTASCDVPRSLLDGGVHTVSASRTDSARYLGSTASRQVRPSATTITFDPANPVYGTTFAGIAKVSAGNGVPPTGTVRFTGNGLDTVVTLYPDGHGDSVAKIFLAQPVDTRTLTAAYSGSADDLVLPSTGSANYTVGKKPLTVTASSAVITYGDAIPAIAPSYAGFITGQGPGNLSTQPTCSTTATQLSGAGSYPTTCSGGVSGNYAFSYVAGTLTKKKAPLTIKVNGTVSYGGGSKALTIVPEGLVNFDTTSSLAGTISCTGSVPSTAPAGTTVSLGTCSGLTSSNYDITFEPGTLKVVKKFLTVVPDDVTRDYGQPNAFTWRYLGFVNGDGPSVVSGQPTFLTSATQTSPPGNYTVFAEAGNLSAANYDFSYSSGRLTIVAAAVTATVSGSQTYGSSSPAFVASGPVPAGVTRTGTPTCTKVTTGSTINGALGAGAYTIDPSTCSGLTIGGPEASNYRLVYAGGPFAVAKAPVTVTTASTSSLLSILTLRITYASKVVNPVSGLPVPGVTVTTRINGGSASTGCSAVTNAQGVATCTAGPVNVAVGVQFTATAAEGPNTKAGTGAGRVGLL